MCSSRKRSNWLSRRARRGGCAPRLSAGRGWLALGIAFWLTPGGPAAAAEVVLDGIAAQVGAEVVLISEVNRIAAPIEARMRAGGAPDGQIAQMKTDVLENLIENRLLDIMAQRAEVIADFEEIDHAIEAIARDNGISVETLRRSVEAQGLTFDAYEEKIAQEIVRQKVLSGMVRPRVEVDEAKVRELYEKRFADQPETGRELHVYHLVVPALEQKSWAIDLACEEAAANRARILNGEPFLDVASETTPTNPDLGWLYEQDLAGWMVENAKDLGEGELSDPIKLSFGCSVIQVVDKREVRPVTFAEAREQLEMELFQEEFDRESRAFFDRMRDETYIERKGGFADTERLTFDPAHAETNVK